MMNPKTLIICFVGLLLLGCATSEPPTKKLQQYSFESNYVYHSDSLRISLKNPLRCPLRIWIQPEEEALMKHFNKINPITLPALSDTIVETKYATGPKSNIKFASRLGDIHKKTSQPSFQLPFPKNKTYSIIQGNESTPTHNTNWSRYALDLSLAVGDTICAAGDGYVVGIISGYTKGGMDKKWKDYGNFITLYHPESNLFTQYVHLQFNGSLVALGEKVKMGQPIAISGETGQTNIPHLHFNCLEAEHSSAGLRSFPLDSIGKYKISTLKRGHLIQH